MKFTYIFKHSRTPMSSISMTNEYIVPIFFMFTTSAFIKFVFVIHSKLLYSCIKAFLSYVAYNGTEYYSD